MIPHSPPPPICRILVSHKMYVSMYPCVRYSAHLPAPPRLHSPGGPAQQVGDQVRLHTLPPSPACTDLAGQHSRSVTKSVWLIEPRTAITT